MFLLINSLLLSVINFNLVPISNYIRAISAF